MAALEQYEGFIREFLSIEGNTIDDLADVLKITYPEQRGFSPRSIKRFCKDKGIKRKGIVPDEQLDRELQVAVSEVVLEIGT